MYKIPNSIILFTTKMTTKTHPEVLGKAGVLFASGDDLALYGRDRRDYYDPDTDCLGLNLHRSHNNDYAMRFICESPLLVLPPEKKAIMLRLLAEKKLFCRNDNNELYCEEGLGGHNLPPLLMVKVIKRLMEIYSYDIKTIERW